MKTWKQQLSKLEQGDFLKRLPPPRARVTTKQPPKGLINLYRKIPTEKRGRKTVPG